MSIKGFNISGTTYKVDYPELDNLPQINGNDLVGDLNAEDLGLDQVYWVVYRMATNAEIEAALNAGKIVLCRVPNPLALLDPPVVCQLTQRNSATNHRFAAITTGAEILLYVAYCVNNSWTSGVFKLATDASVPDPNPNPAAPLGEASAGTSNTYSRGDHVHAMPSAEDVGAIRDPDTKSNGQVLTYNGYSWVAATPSGGGLSQEAKSALMDCFAHVAWADANGQTYYNALASALGLRTLTSISAVYTQSGTVYDTDTLDSLKDDLVVTANYSDSSTQTVPAADYTLSGTLTEGTSTITVSYGGKTATFNVTVTAHLWLFMAGYTVGKAVSGTYKNKIYRQSTAARACGVVPIENKGYVFTVTDSSKYNIAAYDVTDLTQITPAPSAAIDGYCYQGGTKSVSWKTSDSVSSAYVWLALKKMDGSAFTDEELANGAEAVFTYTEAE